MEVSIVNGCLDFLALAFVTGLSLLLEVDMLREHLPGLSRLLEQTQEADDTARRRLTLLALCYAVVATALLKIFKPRTPRGSLNLKWK